MDCNLSGMDSYAKTFPELVGLSLNMSSTIRDKMSSSLHHRSWSTSPKESLTLPGKIFQYTQMN